MTVPSTVALDSDSLTIPDPAPSQLQALAADSTFLNVPAVP